MMFMKSWDPSWEQIFSSSPWGKYPPEELIRFIARNFYNVPNRKIIKILDLGCGPGSCSWYLAREGFSVFGIDGSPTAIRNAKERLASEGLKGDFEVGDFIELPYPNSYFDCVIDIESLYANTFVKSTIIMTEIYRVLKPGGMFFSMSFKDGCYGDGSGKQIELHTFEDVTEGPLAGKGVTRLSPEREIRQLYSTLNELSLEYSIRSIDNMMHEIAQWVISCRKPLDGI
jgi:ubiquinone/menaquinone biosynthesis C-methylase UbiE